MGGIEDFIYNILWFINETLIPLLFTLAFLFFIFNAARYFIIQGAQEEAREKAKRLALWGIIAFVFMLSIWGIVNLLVDSFGFGFFQQPLTPDYIEGGGYGGAGGTGADYTCTDLFGGFVWCSD